MSKEFNNPNSDEYPGIFGRSRRNQSVEKLTRNFDLQTLHYLSERVVNYLLDSLQMEEFWRDDFRDRFNDFSFYTAPAYKAFEGFLFQIAEDLELPSSGDPKFVGTYFDEEKVDKTIDKLIKELEQKAEKTTKLTKQEKLHIKDMIKEMKRFLQHYRHTPAHFHGEPINTIEKARQNILSMYRIIDETSKTLLKTELIQIKEEAH